MFLDYSKIFVFGGKGGDGCVSFRREKNVPKGGPNGGDGGKGGDVILLVDYNLKTLIDFKYRHHFKAGKGGNGEGSNRHGKNGTDCIIRIPPGTIVKDANTEEIIADMTQNGESYIIAKGGKGGLGNTHFATPTHQTPRHATPGQEGEERCIILELHLIADVGIVGYPNAGKSTLLSVLSDAKPKIADYPFTTLHPNLGVAKIDIGQSFVLADIPGLIEGASEGKGLGHQFLRHISRTKILVFLIDITLPDVHLNYKTLINELSLYDENLLTLPRLIVLNKIDLINDEVLNKDDFDFDGIKPYFISSATGKGLDELKFAIWNQVKKIR
jgi:GTP-binding protein